MFACAFCPFCSFTIFHPSCCHHLLSSPSIHQQPMLSKTIRLVFFLLLILYKRASVLLHVFLLHSPLSVPLFSTPSWWQRVRAVRPDCYSNFLMVRVAGLWWCFTSVWCLCVCVFVPASWLFLCAPSRAITGLFEMLKSIRAMCLRQSFSTCLGESLSAMMAVAAVVVFELILSLNALIRAPDGGISLHLHMLTLTLTSYLSLIVVFHQDILGTKTSKSPGWCADTHIQ